MHGIQEAHMNGSLRIAVADDEADMRDFFSTILPTLGHQVVAVAKTGRELIEQCRELHPDLAVTDIKMPDMDGLDATREINRAGPMPVILVSAYSDDEYLERSKTDYILAYLVKPIKKADLSPAISMAMHRFGLFQELIREAASLRQALEDRKIVERAKGILMKKANLSEEDAFRRLQRLASSKNRKLVEIAHMILTAEEAIQP
jgi:response regulator NasT